MNSTSLAGFLNEPPWQPGETQRTIGTTIVYRGSQYMTNNLKTIYRVEGLIASLNGEYIETAEVYFFEHEADAMASFKLSWHKVTQVEFVHLHSRVGNSVIGHLDGAKRLLGRIIPVEVAKIILTAPTHF